MQEKWVWSLDQEDPLEKEVATHSHILAWQISWTEESSGLSQWGCKRVRQDWASTNMHLHIYAYFMKSHIIFHNNPNLHSHQQCRSSLFSTSLPTLAIYCLFLMIAILTGVWWYLIVVLICISLTTGDIKHHFIYLMTSVYLLLINVYSSPLFIFKSFFFFCYWILWVPYVFCMLTSHQIWMCDLQIFSSGPSATPSFCWSFLLLFRSFYMWCSPTHLFLFVIPKK